MRGCFWPENSLHTDPDLAAARALDGYDQMMKAVRQSAERANSNRPEKPEVLLFAPESESVRGLLIGLHMYARSAAESVPHWRRATEEGLVVAVPESTQVGGDSEPEWADAAITARDVLLARQEAVDCYPDAAAATVIGGASQGGGRAAAIALTGGKLLGGEPSIQTSVPTAGGSRFRRKAIPTSPGSVRRAPVPNFAA